MRIRVPAHAASSTRPATTTVLGQLVPSDGVVMVIEGAKLSFACDTMTAVMGLGQDANKAVTAAITSRQSALQATENSE